MNLSEVSIYLIIGLTAWLLAQILKYIVASLNKGKFASTDRLYLSGGMPSAHSATTVSMMVAIGINEGINSGLFAVVAIFTAVVLYDAVMVRRSSGEQGEALVAFMKEQKSKIKEPFVAKGHTLSEVVAGSILGVVVAVIILSF